MVNYLQLQVLELIIETKDSTTVLLKNSNGKHISFKPGQFLTFFISVNGEEKKFIYSITSLPEELPYVRITVKHNSSSEKFLNLITVGSILKSLPPLGSFTIPDNDSRKNNLIFFGAGSGITPLFPMIKYALMNNITQNILLYYGNRSESSIIYHKELSQLENTFPGRFKIFHFLSKPTGTKDYLRGRLTKNETIKQLSLLGQQMINDANFFICGPEGMMQGVLEGLSELNIDTNNIHTENFSLRIIDYDENIELIDREVTILLSGEQYKINVEAGNTILQQALLANISIPNSCNYATCGTCRAKLISGTIMLGNQTVLTKKEKENGFCLTCVGYPVSMNVVILYENTFED